MIDPYPRPPSGRSHAQCSGRGNGGVSTDHWTAAAAVLCLALRLLARALPAWPRTREMGLAQRLSAQARCPSSPPSSSPQRTVAVRRQPVTCAAAPRGPCATAQDARGSQRPACSRRSSPSRLSHCNNKPSRCCRPADPLTASTPRAFKYRPLPARLGNFSVSLNPVTQQPALVRHLHVSHRRRKFPPRPNCPSVICPHPPIPVHHVDPHHGQQGQSELASSPVAACPPAAADLLCASREEQQRRPTTLRWLCLPFGRRPSPSLARVSPPSNLLSADCERPIPSYSLSVQQCLLQFLSSLWHPTIVGRICSSSRSESIPVQLRPRGRSAHCRMGQRLHERGRRRQEAHGLCGCHPRRLDCDTGC